MSDKNENTELFDVSEQTINEILDVKAESDTPPGESSAPAESVELPDAEGEVDTTTETLPEAETAEETETETQEEETPEEPDAQEEPEEAEAEVDKELVVEKDGRRYDFSTAPKEMREVVRSQNRLVNAFVRDNIETVQEELQRLSPSSYANLEQAIVQRSAETNADKWAEYLVSTKPDAIKQILFGEDAKDVSLDAIKEMARIYREESEEGDDLRMTLELRNPEFAANAKPKLAPEELSELEEYRRKVKEETEAKKQAEVQQIYAEVFDYVDDEVVVPVVKQFGLMPTAEDDEATRRNKERIVNGLAQVVDRELSSDPETKDDYAKLLKKIEAHDKAGAMALLPSLNAKIEETAVSYFGFIRNQQTASLKQKHTPAKKPPAAIASAGKTPPTPPKAVTLAERLETQSDEEMLRAMGLAT